MKLACALSVGAMAFAPLVHAQSDHMKDMDRKQPHPELRRQAQSHHAAGVVKSVDAGKGSISVAHGPIASLNWPAMTMAFKVKDKAMLQNVKPGAKVEFDFEQRGKDYVITSLR